MFIRLLKFYVGKWLWIGREIAHSRKKIPMSAGMKVAITSKKNCLIYGNVQEGSQ